MVAQAAVRNSRDVVALGIALGLTAYVNGFVADLQWLGVDAAWDLGRLLRPDDRFDSFLGLQYAALRIADAFELALPGASRCGIGATHDIE